MDGSLQLVRYEAALSTDDGDYSKDRPSKDILLQKYNPLKLELA